ncbi:MAG: putative lipid II flippase FtsW [Oligoflexales bacterium]|nr:putative lipid II flippase FtsW [Oligoflexales bacterium]
MEEKRNSSVMSSSASIILTSLLLTGIGLLVIYTSSSIPAYQKFGDSLFFFRKQAAVSFIGIVLIILIHKIPFRWIEILTLPALFISLIFLSFCLVPGIRQTANGATRWIRLFGITFQPAELAKLSLILFLSKNLSRPSFDINKISSGIIPNLIVFSIFGVLLMIQPDFGSTFMLFLLTFLMLFTAGLSRKYIATSLGCGIVFIGLAILEAPYRIARLLTFIDPWSDLQRGGFQIIQSYLGFQNGGLFGLGLGESKQKLYFLPEAHTDFILSVIGEELGLLGVLFIISCFLYLTYLGIKITRKQRDQYKKFLCFGLTAMISLQAAINMGVCMGALPTKGIPLPFVSSGASSLVIFLISVGLLSKLGLDANKHTDV